MSIVDIYSIPIFDDQGLFYKVRMEIVDVILLYNHLIFSSFGKLTAFFAEIVATTPFDIPL